MESDGVLKPLEVSDWATPIVCVPKTDGSVRICGDYTGTVNPVIQTEQFPIPTLEEIRGKVSTWNKFTKIAKCLSATGFGRGVAEAVFDQHPQTFVPIYTFTIWNFIQSSHLAAFN